jgi:hypothetical protein
MGPENAVAMVDVSASLVPVSVVVTSVQVVM